MACEDGVSAGERPKVAIITGGNGVLGVKIAQRLFECFPLVQEQGPERIHIILACRSRAKAEAAMAGLRTLFPERDLLLSFEHLDLSHMRNVENFCKRILESGQVIDWLIFNAGVAEVTSLNWITLTHQIITDPILFCTVPNYLIERVGSMSEDGIGHIFQANVFGHYYILKRLTSLLTERSKVLWSVSLETALAFIYDPNDPTGVRTHHAYASSKRFIELLHCYLATHPRTPMYFITHPGVTDSGVVTPYQFPIREGIQYLKKGAFYVARWCGSPWHSISGYNGACSVIYCAVKGGREEEMIKWGSGSDRWGRERLLGTTVEGEAKVWEEESKAAFELVERMYQEQIFKLDVHEASTSSAGKIGNGQTD